MIVMNLLTYIFDESKHKGFEIIISVMMKIAAISICISPVFIYFLLYQPSLLLDQPSLTTNKFDPVISYALILGCSCILLLIIYACSTVYVGILLDRKENLTNDEEKVEYYFKNSCIITTIIQSIISAFVIVTYLLNNPSDTFIAQIKELKILIITIIIFIVLSFIIWCFQLKQYTEDLEMKAGNSDTGKIKASTGEDNQSLYRNKINITINVNFNEEENHDE